jgi:hypothetical protein
MAAGLKITVPAYTLSYDRAELRKVLRSAGAEVAALARAMIRKASGGGRRYSKPGGGRYSASQPGNPPVSRTRTLVSSIRVQTRLKGLSVRVIDAAFYSRFLETGAVGGGGAKGQRNIRRRRGGRRGKYVLLQVIGRRHMEPRPFLTAAMAAKGDSISVRVRDAVIQGIAFKRQK